MPLLLGVCVLLPHADFRPAEIYYCLCWPTDSSTEHITCCRPHLILLFLSYGTGMAVASPTPEGPMEVFNEPGTVFHCSDEQFFSLCVGVKEGFVCFPADNRRVR